MKSLAAALADFRAALPDKARIYIGGGAGEPLGVADAMRADPQLARGLTFLGAWIPGINRTDWASLHETARAETTFLPSDWRASFEGGKTTFRPLDYTQVWSWLRTTPLDAAVIMVSPPGADGTASLGVSVDFAGAVMGRPGVKTLALVNPAMPEPEDSPRYPLTAFDAVAEDDRALPQVPPAPLPPAFDAIAAHVAGLIDDGDALQFGIGNVQQAVLGVLGGHKSLRIHSGMVSDPLLPLLDAGIIETIVTGVAAGTDALYARAAADPCFSFRFVPETHGLAALSAVPRLKAVNSAIEVDLFGQANAEFINGRQVSGVGGLADFLRGAQASDGGRGIVALASTAAKGAVSRIVARLPANPTTIARTDMDTVVTEHAVAELRGRTLDERADALIAVADPSFRNELADQWDAMRRAM